MGGCARLNQRSSELMRVPPGARERTHRGRAHWHRVPRPETGGRGGAPRRGGSEQPIRPAAVHPGRARQARVLDARPKGARPAAHDRGRRCNVRNEAAHIPNCDVQPSIAHALLTRPARACVWTARTKPGGRAIRASRTPSRRARDQQCHRASMWAPGSLSHRDARSSGVNRWSNPRGSQACMACRQRGSRGAPSARPHAPRLQAADQRRCRCRCRFHRRRTR